MIITASKPKVHDQINGVLVIIKASCTVNYGHTLGCIFSGHKNNGQKANYGPLLENILNQFLFRFFFK